MNEVIDVDYKMCSVCYGVFEEYYDTKCPHSICIGCSEKIIKLSDDSVPYYVCPICKYKKIHIPPWAEDVDIIRFRYRSIIPSLMYIFRRCC